MNVKNIGNDTEKMLLELLQDKGYWCHLFAYNKNGQPCDIIAIKDNEAWLIDAKHCEGKRFNFNRIEPNQRNCFKYAKSCGNNKTGFAIYFEETNKWRWLSYNDLEAYMRFNMKSVNESECEELSL